jgi:membrane protease YdiL (CAAX protease family)
VTNHVTAAQNGERPPHSIRQERLFELLVFLFLIVPSMIFSFFLIPGGTVGFVTTATATMLRDLALVCLIVYFLWRNGEPRQKIGWTFRNGWQDILLGILLFAAVFPAAFVVDSFFRDLGLSQAPKSASSFLTFSGTREAVVAMILVVVVAFAEEIIFRGYLIARLLELTRSRTASVLLSAFIFSLGHGYEGGAGAATVGFMGAVFALVYLWRRSLAAPITMHFFQDLTVIVIVPLIGHGHS